ncbi:type II toxin-antitoxin system RelE/ParE family toxin [Candidatus Ruminimicrobium bovinum]|uniref:type II toxin-antitoxin system RelE/ParE family toxin n=1 Tax=Candidatus Ruminimicrobium bovinum TaxID=3242779 RepID=UPI0039B9BF5F
MNKNYNVIYLPLFEKDLSEAVDYISINLKSPQAALKLIDKVEKAIMKRLSAPKAFEPFISKKKRKEQYYRIYVNNFTIFYVVIGNTMEVRRFVYSRRHLEELV